MVDITSVGLTGLYAAQLGLATTSNNIANISTPGYNREIVIQTEQSGVGTGAGYVGGGALVSTIQRQYNSYLSNQLQQQQSLSSQLNTYYTQIQQINNVIGDPSVGLSSAMNNFFNAVSTVSNTPSSVAARQNMISTAQSLTGTFQSINQIMTGLNTSTNQQIATSVASINNDATLIANLNGSIAINTGTSSGQLPNSLLDQRDQLIAQLNQQMQVTATQQPDGSYNVYMGNGQPLVIGSRAMTVTTAPSNSNPGQLTLAYTSPNGAKTQLPTSSIQGGVMGGLTAFRTQSLTPAINALGRIAVGLANTFNSQFSQGVDLNGNLGGQFFNVPAPQVIGNTKNSGSGSVSASITNASQLSGSDYTLTYNGASATSPYTLTRLSDNTVSSYTTVPISVDGVSIAMSGSPALGDSFLIQPTVNAAQNIGVNITDPTKIAAAANTLLATPASTNQGSATIAAPVRDSYTLSFGSGGTSYTLTDTSNPAIAPITGTYTSGTPITITGGASSLSSISLTGTPNAGDSFTISPNANGNPVASAAASNTGTASANPIASIADAVTLTFNSGTPATFTVKDSTTGTTLASNVTYTPSSTGSAAATIAYNGWSTSISGAPQAGDVFTIGPNSNANNDGNNALLLAGLQSQNTLINGTTTYTGAYSQLAAQIGAQTNQLSVSTQAQTNLVNQTTQTQQSLSGVNMDEEAANLIKYQQAYQAAGKAIQTAETIFSTVLSLFR